MENPPFAQWQIDHLRKMREELGLPPEASDVEEVTMDEKLDDGTMGALPSDTADADAGGLSAYNYPNVQKAQTAYEKLAAEQTARYNALERAIAEKRYAPSFSERMFQLSAALAAPTTRRGFGGILENITPVLAAQQKAQRQGEISRQEALEQLQSNRLAQQVALAKQGLTTSLAMARIDAVERKAQQPKLVFADGAWRVQPGTGNAPPINAKGQYVVSTPEEANMVPTGAEFVYATDKSNKVYWGK